MRATRRRPARLVILLGIVLLLASCGSSGKDDKKAGSSPTPAAGNNVAGRSPEQILTSAREAFRSAKSVHVAGALTSGGQKVGLDLRISKSAGSGWLRNETQGIRVDLIGIDGKTYMRGRKAWEKLASPAVAELVGDRWVLMPKQTTGRNPLTEMLALEQFDRQVFGKNVDVIKGQQTTVNGKPAVALDSPRDRLYVATSGKPYPLRLEPRPATGEKLDFSEYDTPVQIKAPVDPLDVSKLAGGGLGG